MVDTGGFTDTSYQFLLFSPLLHNRLTCKVVISCDVQIGPLLPNPLTTNKRGGCRISNVFPVQHKFPQQP